MCEELNDWISVVIGFITLVVTISIPIQIMKIQEYNSLEELYCSFEFAHAFQSVIDFYYNTCNCNVELIPKAYEDKFISDFYNLKNSNMDISSVLHYQRRMLNNYFLSLEKCRESSLLLRRAISRDWTDSVALVCKILIFMNKAVDDNPKIYKDIQNIKYTKMPRTKGINKYLERLYKSLKNEASSIKV